MVIGWPPSSGKFWHSTVKPVNDAGGDGSWSCSRRAPVLPVSPTMSTPRAPSEPSVATHRRRLMAAPSRPHSPGFSCAAALNRGMAGQKIRRPSSSTSTAGNSVSMATSARTGCRPHRLGPPADAVQVRDEQAEQTGDHGGRGRDDGRRRAA
jgi:hypothetical protein